MFKKDGFLHIFIKFVNGHIIKSKLAMVPLLQTYRKMDMEQQQNNVPRMIFRAHNYPDSTRSNYYLFATQNDKVKIVCIKLYVIYIFIFIIYLY